MSETVEVKAGRPTVYSEAMLAKARTYLEGDYDTIPSVVGLAIYLKVAKSTLYLWSDDKEHPFSDILDECLDLQEVKLIGGGLKGDYNSTVTKLMLTKHGYSDKTDTTVANPDGTNLKTTVTFTPVSSDG